MKNIFEFATRELSQDAFLRWLLENYDDPELQDATGNLLKEFCEIDIQDIKDVNTTAQWCNIDISVWITLKDGSKTALFIEDKTYSEEHNQLDNYDNHINWCENEYARIYKINIIKQNAMVFSFCHCEERSDAAIFKQEVRHPVVEHGSTKQEGIPITKNRRYAASFRPAIFRYGMTKRIVKDCRVGRTRPPRNDKLDGFCGKTERF